MVNAFWFFVPVAEAVCQVQANPFVSRRRSQTAPSMESSELNVALVGDSVLDDHYWLDRPADDVRAQTERTLKLAHPDRSVLVHNFAVDESTISCVLRGRVPAGILLFNTRMVLRQATV